MTDLGDAILDRLVEEREWLARRGLPEARYIDTLVKDVQAIIERWRDEALDLTEAAAYSGLARKTLYNKVSTGEIANAGTKGRPRILRRDLPRGPRAATMAH